MPGDNTVDTNPQKDPNDYLATDVSLVVPAMIVLYAIVIYILLKKY